MIESKYYSISSAGLILFGFGIGSLAPWILGMIGGGSILAGLGLLVIFAKLYQILK